MGCEKTPRKVFFFIAALSFFSLTAVVLSFGKAERAYVGSKACKECHEKHAAAFLNSVHYRAWLDKGGQKGCETCHGPGSEHVNNPSPETIITFGWKSRQSVEAQNRQCLDCHQATTALVNWDSGIHKRNDISCSSCHSIHKGDSPIAKQPDICFTCHTDIRSDIRKRSHHPIIEGKVKCSNCHNPHGTLSRRMIQADTANLLCYQCHPEKRGPFMWEHPPVAENCLNCHDPHGTKAVKLLREKVPNLCQDCHDVQRHPGTPYEANNRFTGTAPVNKLYGRACLNCHSVIHGSYAPEDPGNTSNSGRYFLR